MNLVIVESASKAKTIEKYLGKDYKVLASYGHIFEIPSKPDSINVDDSFDIKYEIKNSKNLTSIIDFAKSATHVYFASDPDREGEAISWELEELLRKKKILTPASRITFTEITKNAVLEAMKTPRKIDMNLVEAQKSRAVLDFLVGFNISPVLWKKLKNAKSAGRVQSAALRMIVEREMEILAFVPQEYWSIVMQIADDKSQKIDANVVSFNDKKFSNSYPESEKTANEVLDFINQNKQNCVIDSSKKTITQKKPLPPFTTSSLQMDALNKFGFSAKKTMQVAQKLYEGVEIKGQTSGLITYMRTDGITIANDAIKSIRDLILKTFSKDYLPEAAIFYKSKIKNAQEAHEAIRPTDITQIPKNIQNFLPDDEFKLYSLIWARTVACQMENAKFEQHSIVFKIQKQHSIEARTTASKILFKGYLEVYEDYQTIADKEITFNVESTKNEIKKTDAKQHFTSPPARLNEGSLIKNLEEKGIGRPSTFASILTTLVTRDYAEIDKKAIRPTQNGIITSTFLEKFFTRYVDYEFTAKLEDELDIISDGKLKKDSFLKDFWTKLKDILGNAEKNDHKTIFNVLTENLEGFLKQEIKRDNLDCDKCNSGKMTINSGRYGYFLSCNSYPECKNIVNISENLGGGQSVEDSEPIFEDGETKVYIKSGKYGRYFEVRNGDKKKNAPLPKDTELTDENIKFLISLPLKIGVIDGNDAAVGIGMYGPYVVHDKKFYSIKGIELKDVTLDDAKRIIEERLKNPPKPRKGFAKKATTVTKRTKKT